MQLLVDKTLINYRIDGDGPAVLLVHGWMNGLRVFDSLTKILAQKYNVIRLDLPNFGHSQENENIINLDNYSELLKNFLQKLKITKLEFALGHSMGGQILMHAVATKKLVPKRLVLLASAGIRDERKTYKKSLKYLAKVLKPVTPTAVKKKLYQLIGSDAGANLTPLQRKVLSGVLDQDIQQYAKQIEIPTLLVYGDRDSSTPLRHGQKLNQLINKSTLKVLSGSGHGLQDKYSAPIANLIENFV